MVLFLAVSTTTCCQSREASKTERNRSSKIQLTSSAFVEGSVIPSKYTCEGKDISPPLGWNSLPQGTRSLALIGDDPDAPGGVWVHWVVYNISPAVTRLSEGIPTQERLPDGAKQGVNDFNRIGYGGPCPPPGKSHRYFFKLYTLDIKPSFGGAATKNDLLNAMKGHILAEGQLVGTYERKK